MDGCLVLLRTNEAVRNVRGRSVSLTEGSRKLSRLGALLLTVLVATLSSLPPAAAQEIDPVYRLLSGTGELDASPSVPDVEREAPDAEEKRPQLLLGSVVAAGVIAGSAAVALQDGPSRSFHFTSEGFFGRNTYAGGADKAAHFVDSSLASKELAKLYHVMGWTETQARWIGFGVASLAGLAIELGDATTDYGFSPEDMLMNVLGAGTAALIATLGADDLVGFRYGFLLPQRTDTCCPVKGLGHDYSNEIYTADLSLAGLAKRLNLNIGPFRYLLLSLTYGTKGYPHGFPADRQRMVGLEIGLNIRQILDDVGVTRNTWWGYALHAVLDNVRFPYTAVGVRFDLNDRVWHGPTPD
jgi:hypothetical protein